MITSSVAMASNVNPVAMATPANTASAVARTVSARLTKISYAPIGMAIAHANATDATTYLNSLSLNTVSD